ncbi:reverse transcriptase domain protein [Colletotrichum musicola]|uniref:Reverse transcriptase domain protein n=1 Tax=Colletotrichum musicola TaxID=2175873 RepID=A0A8H6MKN2_9PEZI|nr:reverse transcriptase domain protein [Colletotrichum musicola]
MESTKVVQRLTSDADWTKWYGNLKMIARIHEVWEYIDPDSTTAISEPVLVTPDATDLNFSNLFNIAKAEYSVKMEKYKRVNKGIVAVLNWLTSTVEAQYINHVNQQPSVREMLKCLRSELAPDNYSRQQIILTSYNAHMGSIKRMKLADWLSTYVDIMDEVADVKLPALNDSTTQVAQFLTAVKGIAPDYYAGASFTFAQKKEAELEKSGKSAGIQQANDFRQWAKKRLEKAIEEGNSSSGTTPSTNSSTSTKRRQQSSYFTHESSSDSDEPASSDSSSFYSEPLVAPTLSLFTGFPLRDSVIVDSGTGFHICNNPSRMMDIDYKLPQLAHLRRYGCKAYPLTTTYKKGADKSNKSAARAHIGYLCGYDSTNIYRIWIPSINKVMRTRDVTFDESKLYDPNREDTSLLHRQELERVFSQLELPFPDPEKEDLPIDSSLWEDENFREDLVLSNTISNDADCRELRQQPTPPADNDDFQLPEAEPLPAEGKNNE